MKKIFLFVFLIIFLPMKVYSWVIDSESRFTCQFNPEKEVSCAGDLVESLKRSGYEYTRYKNGHYYNSSISSTGTEGSTGYAIVTVKSKKMDPCSDTQILNIDTGQCEDPPPSNPCKQLEGTTTQINLPYHLKDTSSLCMPNSCITVKDDDVVLCAGGDETTPPTCAPVTFRYTGETCTYSDTPDDNLNPPTTDTGGGGGDGTGTGGDGTGTGGDGTGTGGDGTGTGDDGTGTGGDGTGTGGDGTGTGGDGSGTGGDGSGTGGDGTGTGGDGTGTGGASFGSPEAGENPWASILNGEDIEGIQTKVTMLELEVKQAIDNVRDLIATPNLAEGGSMPLFQFNLSHAGGSTQVSTQWMNQIFGDMKSVILLIASMIAFMIVLTRRA